MADTRRYIWVTWLTKLLAGEDKCWWRSWYKAHNRGYEKLPESADRAEFFARWTKKHDDLVAARAAELKRQGYVLKVEEEAAFKLSGAGAIVAGKPDLVAMKSTIGEDPHALVIDGKSGKKRRSDHWQVLIYLFALPLTWLKGSDLRGQVHYTDGPEDVTPLTARSKAAIVEAVRRVSGDAEPPRVPSRWECRYCDIAKCPDRVVIEEPAEGSTTLF